MVDSMDICKSLNINIGIVMRFPEMLIFVPDHVQTNKMCKNAVKKLPSVIRYVPDRYKAQHYIGKDCIKTFCTSLRETQKNIIDFEKKKMLPLTKE